MKDLDISNLKEDVSVESVFRQIKTLSDSYKRIIDKDESLCKLFCRN